MSDLRYTEFILPHHLGKDLGVSNGIAPWFARFAGLRSDEVAELLRADWVGEVGWYLSAEQRIRPMPRSFSEFLEHCALCYQVDGIMNYYNSWDDHFK